jgi:hypothetical protein
MRLSDRLVETYWPLTAVSLRQVQREPGERAIAVITAPEGQFVAVVSDQWHSDEVARRHAAIFDFLKDAGFGHAPAILKTRAGHTYQEIDGQPICILEFAPGHPPARTVANWFRLGESTGELHVIRGYPHDYLLTVADVIPELFGIAETLPFGSAYAQIVRTLPDFGALPVCLIHGEVEGNCIQRPDGRIVAIDWDEAGTGSGSSR